MSGEYFVHKDNKNFGPFTIQQVLELLKKGKINAETMVWRQGLEKWLKIKEMKEFSLHSMGEGDFTKKPPADSSGSERVDIPFAEENDLPGGPAPVGFELPHNFPGLPGRKKTGAPQSEEKIWYVLTKEGRKGPFSGREIIDLATARRLLSDALLQREGTTEKLRAVDIPAFTPFFGNREVDKEKAPAHSSGEDSISRIKEIFSDSQRIQGLKKDIADRCGKFVDAYGLKYIGILFFLVALGSGLYLHLGKSSCTSGAEMVTGRLKSGEREKCCQLKSGGKIVYHGECTRFYPNDQKSFAGNYQNGFPVGKYVVYFRDGKIRKIGQFSADGSTCSQGMLTEYNREGKKKSETEYVVYGGDEFKKNGIHRVFFENGKKLEEVRYVEDVPKGKSIAWYEDGTKREECEYDKVGRGTCKGWYPGGSVEFEGERIAATDSSGKTIIRRDAKWKYLDKDGKIKKVVYYRDGAKENFDFIDLEEVGKVSNKTDIFTAEFSPDAKRVITASSGGIKLFDLVTRKQIAEIRHDNDEIWTFFSPDNRYLIAKLSNVVDIYDSKKGRFAFKIALTGEPLLVRFSRDGRYLGISIRSKIYFANQGFSYVNECLFYNLRKKKEILKVKSDNPIDLITFSADSRYALLQGLDWNKRSQVKFIKLSTGRVLATVKNCAQNGKAYFTPDSKYAVMQIDKSTRVLNFRTGNLVMEIARNVSAENVLISPDSSYFLVRKGNIVEIYTLKKKKLIGRIKHGGQIIDVKFSIDGKLIVTGGKDRKVKIFELKTKKVIVEFKRDNVVSKICLGPNGRYAMFDGSKREKGKKEERALVVFDLKERRIVDEFTHRDFIDDLCFSPDGRFVVFTKSPSRSDRRKRWQYPHTSKIYDVKERRIISTQRNRDVSRTTCFNGSSVYMVDTLGKRARVLKMVD